MTIPQPEQPHSSPSLIDRWLNNFQIWAIQNPDKVISQTLIPIINLIEGLLANNPTYLDSKKLVFGSNFCCAGQVVMGEFSTLETALTSPQGRTWRLGTSVLDASHAPNQDIGGRNLFLLSLSDAEAGGNGDHAAFRQCMQHYLFNEAATNRQRDAIARQLLDQLAIDYQTLSPSRDFFTKTSQGWMGFLIRYLHHVLFALDPNDADSIRLLTELHYNRAGTLHYFGTVGKLWQTVNFWRRSSLPDLIEQAATVYETSPALANFRDGNPDYHLMTRRELAKLMTAIMSIAALQGPLHLGYTAMGFRSLPAYQGRNTSDIQVTQYWDTLNLDDRESVKRYLLECARLWTPVSASHRVATEPFSATIAGVEQSFPAGTKILIPMILGLLDEGFWGTTAYEFNPQRENLCPFHMGFHSVGDRSAGRICPGREIALEMLIDVVTTVGKVRRAST